MKKCTHPGCANHVTHPCEECGRIAGEVPPIMDDIFEAAAAATNSLVEYWQEILAVPPSAYPDERWYRYNQELVKRKLADHTERLKGAGI